MKLAFFTPAAGSGIAQYSRRLLPHLAHWAQIDVYAEGAGPTFDLDGRVRTFAVADYERQAPAEGYDLCLYQMGNSVQHHAAMYRLLLAQPGVVVLHDAHLHDLVAELTAGVGRPEAYVLEMGYAYGPEGLALARAARQGRWLFNPADYPLIERVIDASLGVIVHSQHAANIVRASRPAVQPAVIPLATGIVPLPDRAAARSALGLPQDGPVVSALGYVAPAKRTGAALAAFAGLLERYPVARFLLAGEAVDPDGLAAQIRSLGLEQSVICTGRLANDAYAAALAAADLALNLRYPTHGETSATLMELLAAAQPVIVSDVDAFRELPDDICLKVAPGPREVGDLLAAMTALAGDAERRARLGQAGQSWVRQNCDPAAAAAAYARFLTGVVACA